MGALVVAAGAGAAGRHRVDYEGRDADLILEQFGGGGRHLRVIDQAAHVGQTQAVLGQGVLPRIREVLAFADVALLPELGVDGIGQPIDLVASHQVRDDQEAVVAKARNLTGAQDSHVNSTLPVSPESNTRNASSA